MPRYLIKANYTHQGVKGLLEKGASSRRAAIKSMVEGLGGSLEGVYYALGDTDVFVLVELPGNVDAAAVSMTVCAGGGATTVTIPLLSVEEADEATSRSVSYRPPGS